MKAIRSSPFISKIHNLNVSHLSLTTEHENNSKSNISIIQPDIDPKLLFNTPTRETPFTTQSKRKNQTVVNPIEEIIARNQSADVQRLAEDIRMISDRIDKLETTKATGTKRRRSISEIDIVSPKKPDCEQKEESIFYDYCTGVDDDDDEKETDQQLSPYRNIDEIYKEYEKYQNVFRILNEQLHSASPVDRQKLLDRFEELTGLFQHLQEEYRLAIQWNQENGMKKDIAQDLTQLDLGVSKTRNISVISADLNQVEELYVTLKKTFKKCQPSKWSQTLLQMIHQRFDDLTNELKNSKLQSPNSDASTTLTTSEPLELINKLNYVVKMIESQQTVLLQTNGLERNKIIVHIKELFKEINNTVSELMSCDEINKKDLISVIQNISSNIKSSSPAYQEIYRSIQELKLLFQEKQGKRETVIDSLLGQAKDVQNQYELLKKELAGNPSPDRMDEIQATLSKLMRKAEAIENQIHSLNPSETGISNNGELTPIQIQSRISVLSSRYEELLEKLRYAPREDKAKLTAELDAITRETKELSKRVTEMGGMEKNTLKNQIQAVLIEGVRRCKEECRGKEEISGFLRDYCKSHLSVASDKILDELVDIGMKLCTVEL